MARYEKMFGVKHRNRGRPPGSGRDRVIFSTDGKDRRLARKARLRAIAVIVEENRERIRRVYEDEYKWLVMHQEEL